MSTNVKPTAKPVLLQKGLPRPTAAPVPQPGRVTDDEYVKVDVKVDVKVPDDKDKSDDKQLSTTPSPSLRAPSVQNVQDVLAKLKVSIAKIDPNDHKAIAALNRAALFMLGSGDGSAGDLKRYFNAAIGIQLNQTNMGSDIPIAYDGPTWQLAQNSYCGFSISGGIISGNQIQERIGREITLNHLTLRINLQWTVNVGVGVPISQYLEGALPVRMIVIKDKMPPAITPFSYTNTAAIQSFGAVLFNDEAKSTSVAQLGSFNPVTKGYRYEILHDEIINPGTSPTAGVYLTAGGQNIAGSFNHSIERHIKVHGTKCTWADDAVAPTTSPMTNEISVMFFQDSTIIGWSTYLDIKSELTWRDDAS